MIPRLAGWLGAPPWVVAHRGDPFVELENTLAGLRRAPETGAVMLELDLQLTADGEPVVFHDRDLVRLGGSPRVVGACRAAELADVELRLDVEGRALVGRIPHLAEVFEALPPAYPLNLELKRYGAALGHWVDSLSPWLDRWSPLLVSSFDHRLLAALRHAHPDLAMAPLGRHREADLVAAARGLGASAVHAHRRIAAAVVDEAGAGPPVLAYTVDDPGQASKLLAAGVAGLFSNRPRRLLEALA